MRSSEQSRFNRARPFYTKAVLASLLLLIPHSSFLTASDKKQKAELFEPGAHYYKAKGSGVSVEWVVKQKTVPEGTDFTATLVITGATNPSEIEKPDLKNLPAFADRFVIINVPDSAPAPDAKEVHFTYKLRPRNRKVDKVPALEFYYYNPAAVPEKRFPKTVARSVALTVTDPPPVAPLPPVPLEAPEFLFTNETGPDVPGSPPIVRCVKGWTAIMLFGPLAALGWYLVWRRIYPDAARLARMRRSRVARRALDAIRKAARTPDPPATIGNAVLGYLRMRFPLPESAATP